MWVLQNEPGSSERIASILSNTPDIRCFILFYFIYTLKSYFCVSLLVLFWPSSCLNSFLWVFFYFLHVIIFPLSITSHNCNTYFPSKVYQKEGVKRRGGVESVNKSKEQWYICIKCNEICFYALTIKISVLRVESEKCAIQKILILPKLQFKINVLIDILWGNFLSDEIS